MAPKYFTVYYKVFVKKDLRGKWLIYLLLLIKFTLNIFLQYMVKLDIIMLWVMELVIISL